MDSMSSALGFLARPPSSCRTAATHAGSIISPAPSAGRTGPGPTALPAAAPPSTSTSTSTTAEAASTSGPAAAAAASRGAPAASGVLLALSAAPARLAFPPLRAEAACCCAAICSRNRWSLMMSYSFSIALLPVTARAALANMVSKCQGSGSTSSCLTSRITASPLLGSSFWGCAMKSTDCSTAETSMWFQVEAEEGGGWNSMSAANLSTAIKSASDRSNRANAAPWMVSPPRVSVYASTAVIRSSSCCASLRAVSGSTPSFFRASSEQNSIISNAS
mmetsp:Transcript_11668/g.28611  ORF Transcript_11668/g.28611 Transcript_11668/m.28611 type:complete len:277 (-) Transcript_11668:1056-1886(-)